MPKKTLPTKTIDEPKKTDLDSVMIRMDRDGNPAELRVNYRLRDGEDPTKEIERNKSFDTRFSSLAQNDQAQLGLVLSLAIALVKATEGPFT